MAKPDLNAEIKKFESFLRQAEFVKKPLESGWSAEEFTLFTRGDFTIILRGHDAAAFERTVTGLYEAAGRSRDIAKATISRLASECLVKIAKFDNSATDPAFEVLLKTSLGELRAGLSAPDLAWKIILPIGGLAPSGLPITVGQIQFKVADEQTRDDLKHQAKCVHSQGNNSDNLNAAAEKAFTDRISEFENIAIVQLKALDTETARSVAIKTLRSTVDCINFYADRDRWGMWVYLFGETSAVKEPFIAFRLTDAGKPDSYQAGGRWTGPTRSLPLQELGKLKGFSRISEMLANANLSHAERRLLTSIQWAGRAQVDSRPEEAFLLYAIALESLILGPDKSEGLGYRLCLRCAHLIAPPKERATIKKQLLNLYVLRSAIVHSGKVLVAETELALLRGYCRSAIFRLLNDPLFRQFESNEDLDEWFEKQALGINDTTNPTSI